MSDSQPLICGRCGSFVDDLIDAYGIASLCAACLTRYGGVGFADWVAQGAHAELEGWTRRKALSAAGCMVLCLALATAFFFAIFLVSLLEGAFYVSGVLTGFLVVSAWLCLGAIRRLTSRSILAYLSGDSPTMIGLRPVGLWRRAPTISWIALRDLRRQHSVVIDSWTYPIRIDTRTATGRYIDALARLAEEHGTATMAGDQGYTPSQRNSPASP